MLVCVFSDADETIAWIQEKDAVLSSDDYGRDLASVQALQRKHEGVERDLAALEEKVRIHIFTLAYSRTGAVCKSQGYPGLEQDCRKP
jgi:hypothetical protein